MVNDFYHWSIWPRRKLIIFFFVKFRAKWRFIYDKSSLRWFIVLLNEKKRKTPMYKVTKGPFNCSRFIVITVSFIGIQFGSASIVEKYIKFDTKIHLFSVTILSSPLSFQSLATRKRTRDPNFTRLQFNSVTRAVLPLRDRRAMDFEKHRK